MTSATIADVGYDSRFGLLSEFRSHQRLRTFLLKS